MASARTVVIAGATGFVGRALAARLSRRCKVIGLTRGRIAPPPYKGIDWRSCDLFSLLQCESALKGADTAFYLVHSMLPSAHLTQGPFQDMDLIIADNFARAAERAGVRHIIYVGGLIPSSGELSLHLKSRLEVQQTLGSRGVPVTALRCGIVVGAGGSSFGMMTRALRRLPVIPCPRWARTPSQPIALSDLLDLLVYSLENPTGRSAHHDIGCPEVLSYRLMMERMARILGLKRTFIDVPIPGSFWCRHWMPLITGAPIELVAPLLESMRFPMVAADRSFQKKAGVPGIPFDTAVRQALAEEATAPPAARFARERAYFSAHNVRSVQKLPLPKGRTARWAAEQYGSWMPLLFRAFLSAEQDAEKNVRLMLRFPRLLLLEHRFAQGRNVSPDRQVFYISGGALAKADHRATRRARLEFREVLGGSHLLVAIHDYRPTLPWWLYNATQAILHPWVIRGFARYLAGLK